MGTRAGRATTLCWPPRVAIWVATYVRMRKAKQILHAIHINVAMEDRSTDLFERACPNNDVLHVKDVVDRHVVVPESSTEKINLDFGVRPRDDDDAKVNRVIIHFHAQRHG